ncbi:hypothetical protein [Bacillus sp. AK128]
MHNKTSVNSTYEEEMIILTDEELDRFLDEVIIDAVFQYFTDDWFE